MVIVLALLAPGGGVAARHAPRHPVAAMWVADAICETGHNPPDWFGAAGVFEGGPRFAASTWRWWASKVGAYPRYAHAYQAPPWVQVRVAEWGLRFGAPGPGPHRWGCLLHADVWALR